MFDWLSKKRKEQQRKQMHELKLKASLSEKLTHYEKARQSTPPDPLDNDHTEMILNGRRLRVAKKEITLTDIED